MNRILLLLFLLLATPGFSQELLMETEDIHSSDVIEPKFNGGDFNSFINYVRKEFDFSKVTKAGKLVFSFTISETGAMTNLRILQYVDMASASEIIRVLQNAPAWESAKRAGKPFSVNVKYPLVFK